MEEVQNTINNKVENGLETYLCLTDSNGGKFEVDLVTFREKGQQTKFLSISFVDDKDNLITKTFDIDSFNAIKSFFSKLDWNL